MRRGVGAAHLACRRRTTVMRVCPAMSLRGADLRFVLPHSVETAVVVGRSRQPLVASLAAGFEEAGIRVSSPATAHRNRLPDVVLAVGADGAEALGTPARAHLLLGDVPIGVRRSTRSMLPMLLRGDATAPRLVLPLAPPAPLAHYLSRLASPRSRLRRGRNRLLSTLGRLPLPAQSLVPSCNLVTLVRGHGTDGAPPAILQAAATLGVRPGASWLLSLGNGDDLQRAVFHVLDGAHPAWVVKFSRVHGYQASFVRDEAGLALVRAAGGLVQAHAPRHLGRLQVGGLSVSAETAAAGQQLLHLLPARPMALLDTIADWIVQLGRQTARPALALDEERLRLRQLVAAQGPLLGLPADLLDQLPPVPAVLQHNDIGSWNIVSDGRSFTVVDWESARQSGFPLWDLFYFAGDALARLDGPADADTLVRRTLQIFAGQSRHSAVLFRWVWAAADALAVPRSALGRLASLCWLHHAQSAAQRTADLRGAPPASLGHLALLAPAWLEHPGLGLQWPSLTR